MLTPDEIAEAIKTLIENNGGRLTELSFLTAGKEAIGEHRYNLLEYPVLKSVLPRVVFIR